MVAAVMVLGLLVEAGAWWLVARGGRSVWVVMTAALAGMGAAALLAGSPPASPAVPPALALAVGASAGLSLYAATRAFVFVVRGWRMFRRHAERMYARQEDLPLWVVLVVSLGVMVVGEELFWRGFFQVRLGRALDGRAAAATLSWLAFVTSNLPSANLAIVAGASVGGAAWTALGWWTHGFLASLACHVTWTGLMLTAPVVPTRGRP